MHTEIKLETFALFLRKVHCWQLHIFTPFLWLAAELNDEPLYIVTNEGQLKLMNGQEPDVREAYDVYNPVENIHQHAGRINDQAETYIEPLEQNGE